MNKVLILETADGKVIAKGNTYPVKEELKPLGFKWAPIAKHWFITLNENTNADAALLAISEELNGKNIEHVVQGISPEKVTELKKVDATKKLHIIKKDADGSFSKFCSCGADTYVCQKCGSVLCQVASPDGGWHPEITGNPNAGLVCNQCFEKHVVHEELKKKKAQAIPAWTATPKKKVRTISPPSEFNLFHTQQKHTSSVYVSKTKPITIDNFLLTESAKICLKHSSDMQISHDGMWCVIRDFGADLTKKEVFEHFAEPIKHAKRHGLFFAVRANGVRYTFEGSEYKEEKAGKVKGTLVRFKATASDVYNIKHNIWATVEELPDLNGDFATVWKVDKNYNFMQEIANLYVLYDIKNFAEDVPEMVPNLYKETLNKLRDQIHAYLDFASGGELRHYNSCYESKNKYPLPLLAFAKRYQDRHTAWKQWKAFRDRYPEALQWAYNAFSLKWSGAYGGKKWRQASDLLLKYEKDEVTDMMFVDTAIGIHHNTGPIFNKLWNTHGIQLLCDSVHAGNMKAVVLSASDPIKKIWENVNGK